MLIKIFARTDDSEAVVAITRRIRNGPGHRRVIAKMLIGLIGDVIRRRADSKNGIQEELQRTTTRTHDEIGLTDGIGKAVAGSESHLLNADEQGYTEGDRQQSRLVHIICK